MDVSRGSSRSSDGFGETLWYYIGERWLYMRADASGRAEAMLFGLDCPVPGEDDSGASELLVHTSSGFVLRVPRRNRNLLRLVSPAGIEPVENSQTPEQLAAFVGDIVDGRLPIDEELRAVVDQESLRRLLNKHARRQT